MAKKSDMPATEADYQADGDLHHLIQAAKIHADPKRHKAAMKRHKVHVSRNAEERKALQQVAANAQQAPADDDTQGVGMGQMGGGMPSANGGAF